MSSTGSLVAALVGGPVAVVAEKLVQGRNCSISTTECLLLIGQLLSL